MEEPKSFCIPSIHPNICSALESIKGRSSSNTDNSALENTSPSFVLQKPNFPSNSKQLTDIALRPRTGASDGENPQASRVDSVQKRFITSGFSKTTAEILSKALRTKTNKQYQSAWRLLLGWCSRRSVELFQPSIVRLWNFCLVNSRKIRHIVQCTVIAQFYLPLLHRLMVFRLKISNCFTFYERFI